MKALLVLRPEPGASATAARARELGLASVAVPLFRVEPLEWQAPDAGEFDALLLTSANAVRHGGDALQGLRALPVFAVGEATATAARHAGFTVAAAGNDGVDRLFASIEPKLRVLHLCGEHRRSPEDAPQEIVRIPVYASRAIAQPCMSAADGCVAMIHSPRAGRRFAELVTANRGSIAVAAISSRAAEVVGGGWQTIATAERPTDEALLALAARLCNNPPQR